VDGHYDRKRVAASFNVYGEREWERHEDSVAARVSFLNHQAFLGDRVHSADRVLEVGAGPGRFTIELAKLGAIVTAVDISPVQLELHESHVGAAGAEASVERRVFADVVDLSAFDSSSFDAVVCFGAPLSFVMERVDGAFAELVRVVRPRGVILLSVASRFGTMRAFLPAVHEEIVQDSIEWTEAVIATGDLTSPHASLGVPMHLFTWEELRRLIARHRCEVLDAAAANFLSTADPATCQSFADDERLWPRFLEWERAACRERGAIDGGTAIVAAVRRQERPLRSEE